MGRDRFSRPGCGVHTAQDGKELWPPVLWADSPEAVDVSFPCGKCVGGTFEELACGQGLQCLGLC